MAVAIGGARTVSTCGSSGPPVAAGDAARAPMAPRRARGERPPARQPAAGRALVAGPLARHRALEREAHLRRGREAQLRPRGHRAVHEARDFARRVRGGLHERDHLSALDLAAR